VRRGGHPMARARRPGQGLRRLPDPARREREAGGDARPPLAQNSHNSRNPPSDRDAVHSAHCANSARDIGGRSTTRGPYVLDVAAPDSGPPHCSDDPLSPGRPPAGLCRTGETGGRGRSSPSHGDKNPVGNSVGAVSGHHPTVWFFSSQVVSYTCAAAPGLCGVSGGRGLRGLQPTLTATTGSYGRPVRHPTLSRLIATTN
jgi:hypothetical protein